MKTTIADLTDTVTDAVGDAWTASSHFAADLASTTADKASDLATAAAHQVPEATDRVAGLVDRARQRIQPAPKRTVRPWMVVVAALATLGAVAWWMQRRRDSWDLDQGPGQGTNPLRSTQTSRAQAAAGD